MGNGKLIAFGYYGGKYSHLDWLLPLLPTHGIQHYCEPFGGSAAVLLNRPPAPVETYNDLDGEVVNFFRVLRTDRDELIRQCALTPFSREVFIEALDNGPHYPPTERARRFYTALRQARYAQPNASPGQWAYCIEQSRNGMGSAVSRTLNGLDGLADVAARLLRVQIECLPAIDVIGRYDTPETLFYCDPPYVEETREAMSTYKHELTIERQRELAASLVACRGKVAISGYDSPLYRELYEGWYSTRAIEKAIHSGTGATRQEILWTNYDPATIHPERQLELFGDVK